MTVALKTGSLAGIPARIVSWGDQVQTLGEPDQLVVIAFDEPQALLGYRLSRLMVCLSELTTSAPTEFAA